MMTVKRKFLGLAFGLVWLAPQLASAQVGVLGANEVTAQAGDSGSVRIIARVAPTVRTRSGEVVSRAVSAAADSLAGQLQTRGASNSSSIPELGLVVTEVSREQLDQLIASGEIEAVQIDRLNAPGLNQSIPLIKANEVHASGKKGQGFAVAIIDTGVDSSHPHFTGRVVAEACFSSRRGGSLCPNGNRSQTGTGSAVPTRCAGVSGCDHGTHVAGIAAGRNATYNGVAPDANIVAIQVFSRFTSDSDCGAGRSPCVLSYDSDMLRALSWLGGQVTRHKVVAANMSIGGGHFRSHCDGSSMHRTIQQLWQRGVATVISSGNDDFTDAVGSPGCISSAVTVGSTTKQDGISSFSNSARMVDLLAPGSSIVSSVIGGGTGNKSGTSMAAPHVTGAFALLKSVKPTATPAEILRALQSTGVPIRDTRRPCAADPANGFPACRSTGIVRNRIDVRAAQQVLAAENAANEAGDKFGTAVAFADFNGDGYKDLAVGAPGERLGQGPRAGEVSLFKGSAQGLRFWKRLTQSGIGTDEPGDRFGFALAAADFNGDGKADLAVGAPRKKIDGKRAGKVFLYKGGNDVTGWHAIDQTGMGRNETGDLFGGTLAAGDLNRDGKADLVVGAPGESIGRQRSGYVFLFKGGDRVTRWRGLSQTGLGRNEDGDRFGYALAVGDFDGNGHNELAVGAPTESPGRGPDAGWVFLYRGGATIRIWKGISQQQVEGEEHEAGDQFGFALASDDFNGDGKDDLVVGSPGESPASAGASGAIFVFPGTDRGPVQGQLFHQGPTDRNEVGDRFGDSLATGDFNGDGKADLAVGAPGEAPGAHARSGAVYVFNGGNGGITQANQQLKQVPDRTNENGDLFGDSLAAGDFDRDGKVDLAVGTPGEAPGPDPKSGYVYILKGSSRGLGGLTGRGQE